MASLTRLVLDTNIWLDWLVFDEAAMAPLREAHEARRIEIVMDAACEAELERVLAYDLGRRTLEAGERAACLERCRGLVRRIDAISTEALPTCRDPDDQKFLELALAARADFLVTRDRALLDLARRVAHFRIVTPDELGSL